jgi:CBS domain-containing protein
MTRILPISQRLGLDATQIMRGNDIGDVIVLQDDRLFGILTDRDIVVRVLAEGGDKPPRWEISAVVTRPSSRRAWATPYASCGRRPLAVSRGGRRGP